MLQSQIAPWRICLIAGALLGLNRIFSRKISRFKTTVVLLALLVGAMVMSFRQVSLERSEIHKLIGKDVTLDFIAVSDPKAIDGGRVSLIAKAKGVPVRVIGFGKELLPSQNFRAQGKLVQSKEPRVAALFLTWEPFEEIKDPNQIQTLFGNIRAGLRDVSRDAPLIPGMVLGDTSLQTPEFTTAMRRAGLTHLTAVSGANFAIVSSFVLWLMQYPIKRIRIRLLVTALILIAFVGLVRPSPSVLRAAAMAAVVIFSKSNNQRSDSLPSLGFAIAIVVIADPWQSRDPGFALSVLATAGLLLIAPRIKAPRLVAEPIAASLLCAPVIVSLSGYLSLTSIFANILVAPLVAPITILGFISALAPPIAPTLITIAKVPANWITKIAFMAAEPAVLQLKSALLIIFFALFLWWFRKWWILILLFALAMTYLQRWPNNDWQIANCDVGQGDAMVLKVAAHAAVVIDVGSDPVVIDQCLKSLRVDEIPLLILTHPHQDHIGGLAGAIKDRRVGKVLSKAQRGERIQVGNLRIEILWPDGTTHNFTDNGGEGSEVNNQSIVALVSSPDYTLLATGDIEPDAQSMITVPKVKFLKVAHHGSRYQDFNFNQMADPELAIVSVGKGNLYGHPAAQTLKLFRKVLRTDQNGAIAIDPKKMSISSSKVGVLGLPVLWRIA